MTARTLRSLEDLTRAGHMLSNDARLNEVAAHYAIAVTPVMDRLIIRGDTEDPIARQFLPDARELEHMSEELADPIGDHVHERVKGVVHRYPDRVLLKLLHACPVYCRFCFRREMVGPGGEALTAAESALALAYIRNTPAIREVILTGGDPLMLSARRVVSVVSELASIPHLDVVRWHTRVPVVAPERVTAAMVEALANAGGKAVFVAIHANHAREFTPEAERAIRTLADAGVALISQSVLLKGVNADVDALVDLMRAFVRNRIKPYYLHHPDLAPGTSHFRLPIAEGQELVAALRGRISGLCQPTYIFDIPGGHGKVPLLPSAADLESGVVRDYRGQNYEI
jgi:lysine 2,3-aminomutase